jgi:uncharacterized protein YkwD
VQTTKQFPNGKVAGDRTMDRRGIVFTFYLALMIAVPLAAGTPERGQSAFGDGIFLDRFDAASLEKAIVAFTNKTRMQNRLTPCRLDSILCKCARDHSREMADLGYFSHQSPVKKNETMGKRLENAGLNEFPAAGENLGVDYVLDISEVSYYPECRGDRVRYINAKTGMSILNQTYEQFTRHMVENWMKSPPHCANVLNGRFDRIGVGASIGKLNELDAVYVTQIFIDSKSRSTKRENP